MSVTSDGMAVGARWAGLSTLETAVLCDFPIVEGCEKQETSRECLKMEMPCWWEWSEERSWTGSYRKVRVTQVTTLYNRRWATKAVASGIQEQAFEASEGTASPKLYCWRFEKRLGDVLLFFLIPRDQQFWKSRQFPFYPKSPRSEFLLFDVNLNWSAWPTWFVTRMTWMVLLPHDWLAK